MSKFLKKNKNSIVMAMNVMIIALGFFSKDYKFVVIGILLAIASQEKKIEEQKALLKAEKKALLKEQKAKMKGKKKKKKTKKRR